MADWVRGSSVPGTWNESMSPVSTASCILSKQLSIDRRLRTRDYSRDAEVRFDFVLCDFISSPSPSRTRTFIPMHAADA